MKQLPAMLGAVAVAAAAPLIALITPGVSNAEGPCPVDQFWNTATNQCQICPTPNYYWDAATNQCINVPNPILGPAGPIGVGPNPVVGPVGPVGVGPNPVVGPVGPAGVGGLGPVAGPVGPIGIGPR